MHGLEDYREIVGNKVIGEIARKARVFPEHRTLKISHPGPDA
jgi:hypothetical protein